MLSVQRVGGERTENVTDGFPFSTSDHYELRARLFQGLCRDRRQLRDILLAALTMEK